MDAESWSLAAKLRRVGADHGIASGRFQQFLDGMLEYSRCPPDYTAVDDKHVRETAIVINSLQEPTRQRDDASSPRSRWGFRGTGKSYVCLPLRYKGMVPTAQHSNFYSHQQHRHKKTIDT